MDHKKAIIVTRSMNDLLFKEMASLIDLPFNKVRCRGFTDRRGSVDYLHSFFRYRNDWIINIDEDAFVISSSSILRIIDFMTDYRYDYCGMADGGVCLHRTFNPVPVNPFFNIFNIRNMRKLYSKTKRKEIDGTRFTEEMKDLTPFHILKPGFGYEYVEYEDFYSFFYWTALHFKCLYLPSYELTDGITTVLKDPDGKDFLAHAWYSRFYGMDEYHTRRINQLISSIKNKTYK